MKAIVGSGVNLEYDTFGEPEDPSVVLVMGLGAQLIHWPTELCQRLARQGFHVVRFDNRDAGLSTRFDALGAPNPTQIFFKRLFGGRVLPPYTLFDMASDVVGLMDALHIRAAHVMGASMGGMIAQVVALAHPERVLSLTSLMSGTGARFVSQPRALRALIARYPDTREGAIARSMNLFRALHGSRFEFDADLALHLSELAYERGANRDGFLRQLAAIMTASSRRRALKNLRLPTLVWHGLEDPLIPSSCGRATARVVPGARLHLVEGLGHSLPSGCWDELVAVFSRHAVAAELLDEGRRRSQIGQLGRIKLAS